MYSIIIRITAEVSQILVSCETPIQWEQFSLVFITNACSIWYFIQFVPIAIFMSLYGSAGTCIPVAWRLSLMYLQYNMYLSIVVRTYIKNIYIIHARDILGHPS